jgi:tetratricopeptide (TPR) repeat protein
LMNLGRYEEAIASYDKAIEVKPDYHEAWYNNACTYALQSQLDPALEHLKQAIELNPDHYRTLIQTDSDFDSIRDNEQFQILLNKP